MDRRRRRYGLGAALLAFGLLAAFPAGEAVAKGGSKPSITARIAGRHCKWKGVYVAGTHAGPIFEIQGTPRAARLMRGMELLCSTVDVTMPLPATAACGGYFQEERLGRHASGKSWTTSTGIEVTFESFAGGVLRGSFQGTFEIPGKENPGDPPASASGKFVVALP